MYCTAHCGSVNEAPDITRDLRLLNRGAFHETAMEFACVLLITLYASAIAGEVQKRTTMPEAPCTSGPLGMESGAIPDISITASSFYHEDYSPEKARLNTGTAGWIPMEKENQWIQVDLGEYTALTGVVVQGYRTTQHVRTFGVRYSSTGRPDDWQELTDDMGRTLQLNGNDGSGKPVRVDFPTVPVGRYLRLLPMTWTKSAPYALRFEVLGCRDGLVRLVDGGNEWSGRVEVYRRGSWGSVCDQGWDLADARTVCRQLGYALGPLEAPVGSPYGDGGLATAMSRVSCLGTESRLADCPFICDDHRGCGRSHEAGVVCRPNTIRLVGGPNSASGRLEVFRGGRWGTVCDRDWGEEDGAVACRQLGFPGLERVLPGPEASADYGGVIGDSGGDVPVHLEGVACQGNEDKLTDCPSLCWRASGCDHAQDAGVVCQPDITAETRTDPSVA